MAQQGSPPQALVDQWWAEWDTRYPHTLDLARRAAIWAADQQLETCCKVIEERQWFANPDFRLAELRRACRPPEENVINKALGILDHPSTPMVLTPEECSTIRQALESLRPPKSSSVWSQCKPLSNYSVLGAK